MTFKNIKIKKRGGGTRLQRVQVLASGKYKFVKNLTKSVKSSSKKAVKTTSKRKVKRKLARKNKNRRKSQMTIPLAIVAPLAAGIGPSVASIIADPSPENVAGTLNHLALIYTGYNAIDGVFDMGALAKGLFPLIAGGLVHKFVGGAPLNLNRMLAAAKVPFIRI